MLQEFVKEFLSHLITPVPLEPSEDPSSREMSNTQCLFTSDLVEKINFCLEKFSKSKEWRAETLIKVRVKTTLETSVNEKKATLETSVKEKKTTLETSVKEKKATLETGVKDCK